MSDKTRPLKAPEAQNSLAEIKIRAERKAGELLPGLIKQGRPSEKRSHDVTFLEDLGIEKMQSSRWQLEAEWRDKTRDPAQPLARLGSLCFTQ